MLSTLLKTNWDFVPVPRFFRDFVLWVTVLQCFSRYSICACDIFICIFRFSTQLVIQGCTVVANYYPYHLWKKYTKFMNVRIRIWLWFLVLWNDLCVLELYLASIFTSWQLMNIIWHMSLNVCNLEFLSFVKFYLHCSFLLILIHWGYFRKRIFLAAFLNHFKKLWSF